jgi:hypothetical protein
VQKVTTAARLSPPVWLALRECPGSFEHIFDYSRKATIHKSEWEIINRQIWSKHCVFHCSVCSSIGTVFYVLLRMRAADLTRVGKSNPLGFEVWSFNVHSLWAISPQYAPLLHIPFSSPHARLRLHNLSFPKLICLMTISELGRAVAVCIVGYVPTQQVLSQAHIAFVSLPSVSSVAHGLWYATDGSSTRPYHYYSGNRCYFFELTSLSAQMHHAETVSSLAAVLHGGTRKQQFPIFFPR